MSARLATLSLLLLGLLGAAAGQAEPTPAVVAEVNFLLDYIEGSGCEFYRNGYWHDARAAQEHLRDKYNYLVAHGLIDSTEAFIDRAATASSLTGLAYEVRCRGAAAMASNRWLRQELLRVRVF